jgi:hypothetical protein
MSSLVENPHGKKRSRSQTGDISHIIISTQSSTIFVKAPGPKLFRGHKHTQSWVVARPKLPWRIQWMWIWMTNEHNSLTSRMTVSVPSPLHKLQSAHSFTLSRLIRDVLPASVLADPSICRSCPHFSLCQSFPPSDTFVSPPPLKISILVALPPPAIGR